MENLELIFTPVLAAIFTIILLAALWLGKIPFRLLRVLERENQPTMFWVVFAGYLIIDLILIRYSITDGLAAIKIPH